jgi:hypothetical protein
VTANKPLLLRNPLATTLSQWGLAGPVHPGGGLAAAGSAEAPEAGASAAAAKAITAALKRLGMVIVVSILAMGGGGEGLWLGNSRCNSAGPVCAVVTVTCRSI